MYYVRSADRGSDDPHNIYSIVLKMNIPLYYTIYNIGSLNAYVIIIYWITKSIGSNLEGKNVR